MPINKNKSNNSTVTHKLQAWWIWALATTFVIFLFNIQTGYSIINSHLQADTGISLSQVGLIASIYTWAFAICQFFGGALLDKLGAKMVLVPAILLVTIGVYILSIADSFNLLVVSQVVLAIGSCVGFVGAGYIGGQWFGIAKYGVMFGLVQTVASLSSAFGQSGISFALQEMTWRNLATYAVYAGGILFILAAVFIRNPTSVAKLGGSLLTGVERNLLDIIKIPSIWVVALWGAVSFGGQLALGVVWAPKILIAHGIDSLMANFGSSMVWLGLAVGCTFWNRWSESIKKRKIPAATGLIIQLLALSAALFLPLSSDIGLVVMFCYGLGSSAHMISFASASDIVSPTEIGTSASFVNGSMFIMGGILTSIPGYLLSGQSLSLANYQLAFIPLIVLLLFSLVLSLVQKETYPKGNKTL